MRYVLTFFVLLWVHVIFGQGNSFPYGLVTLEQIAAKGYTRDSSASAVILREFGEAYVSSESNEGLIFEHHYIIKILKTEGLNRANISIPLKKVDDRSQRLLAIKASSYNIDNNKIRETSISTKNIFTEHVNKYWDEKKLVVPNVQVGTIIEVQYTIDDPFFYYNFHTWEFQSDLPKVYSEYWATIPGIFIYNITWRGYLKFSKNETSLIQDCYAPGSKRADCGRYKFAMENIPAFREEEYMTVKSNFLAAVYFELSEVRYFNGSVDKITKDWKDADIEIKNEPKIGGQIKRGKDIIQKIEPELIRLKDPLEKAKRIYSFIKESFTWNGYMSSFSEEGIKKAFEKKSGNTGDINLSLIAALRSAGLDAEPALLSTRENGVPTELHPVITDFNYVIGKLTIENMVYLLDATDPYLPFGILPYRCLNGKARVFPERKPSYWYDIVPSEKFKEVAIVNLTLDNSGGLKGTLEYSYYGYTAHEKRTEQASYNNETEYLAELKKNMKFITINSFKTEGLEISEPKVIHKFEVEIEALDKLGESFMLNPFFIDRIERNPFKLRERLYPVNFGALQEYTLILNLTYPETFSLVEKPEKTLLSMPSGGGKFLFDIITDTDNRATMMYSLSLTKPVYASGEYIYLKELYNRVVQVQNFDWLFKKKE